MVESQWRGTRSHDRSPHTVRYHFPEFGEQDSAVDRYLPYLQDVGISLTNCTEERGMLEKFSNVEGWWNEGESEMDFY